MAQNTKGLSLTAESKPTTVGKTYALIIGISQYKNLPSLQYADKDARAFLSFLRSPAGGSADSENIRIILNDKACGGDIWRDVSWLLRKANTAGDRAFIYFSGHGDAANAEEAYLLAHDAPNEGDPNLYNALGGFQVYNLKSKIRQMTTAGVEVVLITDACRSNELPGKADGSKWAYEKIMEKQAGEIQMASCASNEQSMESTAWGGGRGVFSYHLINGLSGMADEDQDGRVSLYEISSYVTAHVRRDTKSPTTGKARQTPVFCCGEYNDKVLGTKDEKYLAELNKNTADNTLLADAGKRGVPKADAATKALYAKYDLALEEGRLIEPEGNNANSYLQTMLKEIKEEDTRADLADRLVAKLINEAQVVINDYSKGLGKIRYDPGTFSDAARKLSVAMHYVQDKSLHSELDASRLFLEARELKESDDSIDIMRGIAKADSSIAINPNQANMLHVLGTLHFKLKQIDQAFQYEYKAVRLANNWGLPYVILGFLNATIHKTDSAIYYLNRAIQINPHHYNELAGYYINYDNNPDSAIHYLHKLIEKYPLYEWGYVSLARNFFLENKDSAIYYYKLAGKINPNSEESCTGLAEFYTSVSVNSDSACKYARRAVQINPKSINASITMGYTYLNLKNTDSAFFYFTKAYELRPNAMGHYQMACFYSRTHNVKLELDHFEKAIKLGFKNLKFLLLDADLDNIRTTPEYKTLMKKYFPKEYKE